MKWQDLVSVLQTKLPEGRVTTYAEVSEWAYGNRTSNQPVGSLLRGASNNGYKTLTNRVVGTDGALAALPGGNQQQQEQLLAEGIPFSGNGRVNFSAITPVSLK